MFFTLFPLLIFDNTMNDDWSGGWFDDEPKQKRRRSWEGLMCIAADTWSDDEDAFAPKTVAKKASVSRSSGSM